MTAAGHMRPHIFAWRMHGAEMAARLSTAASAQLAANETVVGQTAHYIVYTDGSSNGNATAQSVLQNAEADFVAIQAWFSGLTLPAGQNGDDQTTIRTAQPMEVVIDQNAGGAYHYSCDATDLYIEPAGALGPGLVVAEAVEVFEAAQGAGWDCGQTNGEGLSRVLAGERYPALGQDFVPTIQVWWQGGQQDYVNDNSATDQNDAGNGCGTLFLFYLHSQLNYSWQQIVAAGAATLGATYQQLTGQDSQAGFSGFVALVGTLDDGSGQLNLPASGNPFPIAQGG